MSRDQNAGQSHNRKIYNSSFERVEEFKYLGTTLTYQNSIQEGTKSRLNSGNVSYYSVQNILSSILLSKNVNIKIHITIILPVVLYGGETWLLTVKKEVRVRVFENRVLRRIFGPTRARIQGSGETYIKRSLIYCTTHPLYCSSDKIEKNEMGRTCSTYEGEERLIQGLCMET